MRLSLPSGFNAKQADQRRDDRVPPRRGVPGRSVRVRAQLLRQRPAMPTYVPSWLRVARKTLLMLRPCLLSGTHSAGATCTNNVATGYFFDATEIVLAGENATTTQCPPGTAGFATRQCLWNGANSSTGVWAEPLNNCKRMPSGVDTPHALLGWLLIAGVLLFSWPGGLQRLRAPPWRGSTPRLRPSTSAASRVHARLASRAPSRASACTTRRPARPTGGARPILRRAGVRMPRTLTYPLEGCGLTMVAAALLTAGPNPVITCASEEYNFASWPEYIPNGQNIDVEGQCLDGYEPSDPTQGGPKRICQATGGYLSVITNTCKRAFWPARQRGLK